MLIHVRLKPHLQKSVNYFCAIVKDAEKWYFSIIDIVAALTEQSYYQKSRKYWNKLKERLQAEGSQTVTNCHQLKMLAQDSKMRLTDVELEKIL